MIIGHHGWGEEMLIPALASGGSLLSVAMMSGRAKLKELRKWLHRP